MEGPGIFFWLQRCKKPADRINPLAVEKNFIVKNVHVEKILRLLASLLVLTIMACGDARHFDADRLNDPLITGTVVLLPVLGAVLMIAAIVFLSSGRNTPRPLP